MKFSKTCIFRLLFQSLVCSTFTFSTEPLPRMAHDDNDFALCTGQFSGSMSQRQRQTAPALEIAPAASLWDGRQWSHQQVSPLTSRFAGQRPMEQVNVSGYVCTHPPKLYVHAATQDPLLKAAQRHLDLSYDNVVLWDWVTLLLTKSVT